MGVWLYLLCHIDAKNINKLHSKSRKYTFIGYVYDDLGFRFWNKENWKIIKSRNIVFIEKVKHKDKTNV